MHIEFTSLINRFNGQDSGNSAIALDALREAQVRARLLERHNFDRLFISDPDGLPENDQLAAFVLQNTATLSVEISHRAGCVAPTAAAQQLASLDRLGNGRLAVRMVNASGAEADLARTDEYLVLLKRLWANSAPFDHEGPFYSVQKGFVASKPFAEPGIPLSLGGVSGTAIKVAARHADAFVLPFTGIEETRRTISRVMAAAQTVGRAGKIRFSAEIRPILAASAQEASRLANTLDADKERALIGTADQISLGLLRLYELGVSEFIVHGLETPQDIAYFGESIIPMVRRSVIRGEAKSGLASPPYYYQRSDRAGYSGRNS